MKYYAKSEGDISCEQHSKDVVSVWEILYGMYKEHFSEEERKLIFLACKYHDYGKFSTNFAVQMCILKHLEIDSEIKPFLEVYKKLGYQYKFYPHGYLSCAFIPKYIYREIGKRNSKALINAIVYHHARNIRPDMQELIRIIEEDLLKCPVLKKTIETTAINEWYLSHIWYDTAGYNISSCEDDLWVRYAIIKGMLNRADYYASSDKSYPLEIDGEYKGRYLGRLIIDELKAEKKSLRDVQKYMYDNRDENIVVVASTGSGKTEAAFMWADKSKTFYTLPLQVSINAIYDRVVNKYRYPNEKTTLLHSNAVAHLLENETESVEAAVEKYSVSKNLSYPVTICTVDQLFTYVYKYIGSEILLATLKYSKLIIDEIQAYSPEIIGELIYGLKLLQYAGGKFAIMTATLPPVVRDLMDENGIKYKYSSFVLNKVKHKIVYFKSDFDYEKIAELSQNKKVLVICNTVKRAQKVYKQLEEMAGNVFLLHAKYIQCHKRLLEKRIMEFSYSNDSGIWVTTQIVEASLDIDFDVLFTDMCTADSLLQRMGRCYRNRQQDYCDNEPNVYVYETKEEDGSGYGTVYDKFLYDRSSEFLKKYNNNIFDENMKLEYIDNVYDTEALKKSDSGIYDKIQRKINACSGIVPREYSKTEAQKNFRGINSYQVIPRVIYEEMDNNGVLEDIEPQINGNDMEAKILGKNKLMQYVVSVSKRMNYYSANEYMDKLDIKLTPQDYEFDEDTLKGRGLLDEEEGIYMV